MPSYDQTPGSLNLAFNRGDDFSVLVDMSIALSGYTVTASISSLVTGAEVQALGVSKVSDAEGKVSLSLSDTQTLAMPRGTYGWSMRWTEGNATRTALSGFVEVS